MGNISPLIWYHLYYSMLNTDGDMSSLQCVGRFLAIKISITNIYKYANALICILDYVLNSQCISFNLVPISSPRLEYRWRYEYLIVFFADFFSINMQMNKFAYLIIS